MTVKMTDCMLAVTKSGLEPWTSDSLENALKLLTNLKPGR